MNQVLIIYLCGGLVCNIAGPLALQVKYEMADLRRQTVPVNRVQTQRRKLLQSEIIFRMLILLLYPVAYAMWFVDRRRARKEDLSRILRKEKVRQEVTSELEKRKKAIIENRCFTYFGHTRGGGTVRCHGCGFEEDIIDYSHSPEGKRIFTRGFQCQNCGRFHQVSFLGSRPIMPYLKCSCGGELSNLKPLYCPRCKARDVMYMREYAL